MKEEQIVNPWTVKGEIKEDGQSFNINYEKVIKQFGCSQITKELIEKLEKSTSIPVHHLIKRGIVFAHRDFEKILEAHVSGKGIYLYTGRGPSSLSMHIGHAIPFMLCKYLQDAFDIPLVIQITNDEKFLWKELTLEDATKFGRENIKDIMAFGFDPAKTFIFLNTEYMHHYVENTLKIGKSIGYREAQKVFGFDDSHNIGQIEFPVKQIVPCFSSSFKKFKAIKPKSICIIPAAIDQDPYFRLARDKAHIIKEQKPCSIYSSFLPNLTGLDSKMSASEINYGVFLTDTPEEIKNKINKYAFSGGRDTLKEHRELGGRIDIDVPYNYLKFFMEDDEKLKQIAINYSNGSMSTAEIKKECIDIITEFVLRHQEARKKITDDDYNKITSFDK